MRDQFQCGAIDAVLLWQLGLGSSMTVRRMYRLGTASKKNWDRVRVCVWGGGGGWGELKLAERDPKPRPRLS